MKAQILTILFLGLATIGLAQPATPVKAGKKGTFYLALGSHRAFYSPTDIRVIRGTEPSFDFTLHNVRAEDEGGLRWKTAPQFSYRIGYYFNKKNFGIEYSYDHIKYFVKQGQRVHMTGTIQGQPQNKDTTLTADFFQMEHSDGGNYAMINLVKIWPLYSKVKGQPIIDLIGRAGVGIVNPKTNTTILGAHRDDRYHFSGYVVGTEWGTRVHFLKHFYVMGTVKGAYANYNRFLIRDGFGNHQFFSGAFNYFIGGQFPL